MKKIVFISDFFSNEVLGGCELNDRELIIKLSQKTDIKTINSHLVTPLFIREYANNDYKFIISNFTNLSEESKNELLNKKYIIYEHDHKYLSSRNPGLYENFIVPKTKIINLSFYSNAQLILVQSQMHKDIIFRNLKLDNLINLSGNLWNRNIINKLIELSVNKKQDKYMVLDSTIEHKNTKQTIMYCKRKGIQYELVSDPNYVRFLNKMSNFKGLYFFPQVPETLSRICVEARILDMETITNKNVGAVYEPWYRLPSREIADYMIQLPDKVYNLLEDIL